MTSVLGIIAISYLLPYNGDTTSNSNRHITVTVNLVVSMYDPVRFI
nr:MAG TPA: hypothetical protein [Bacteriophage sp.]